MRGMYTVGALDVMMEEGIGYDMVVGVSAGALFGVNFLSGQKGRALRYNQRFAGNKEYMGLYPLLKEGNLVGTELAYHKVPEEYDPFDNEAFMASGIPFYAVVTDVETGEPVYKRLTDVFAQMDTLRASGSMPFVSRPVEIDGNYYLDGGISDSIPYAFAASKGAGKLVVILTRDLSYRKKPMNRLALQFYKKKFPMIAARLRNRHDEYNKAVAQLAAWEKEGKAFVLRPSQPIEIGKMEKDPVKLQMVYDLGRKDMKEKLEALKEYLNA